MLFNDAVSSAELRMCWTDHEPNLDEDGRILFAGIVYCSLRETSGSLNVTWPKFELCTSEQKSGALPQHKAAR
jgi:hypothetical protein